MNPDNDQVLGEAELIEQERRFWEDVLLLERSPVFTQLLREGDVGRMASFARALLARGPAMTEPVLHAQAPAITPRDWSITIAGRTPSETAIDAADLALLSEWLRLLVETFKASGYIVDTATIDGRALFEASAT